MEKIVVSKLTTGDVLLRKHSLGNFTPVLTHPNQLDHQIQGTIYFKQVSQAKQESGFIRGETTTARWSRN